MHEQHDEAIDDRSPMAKALSKVSQITAISLMMIVPAIIGYFVDQWLGTKMLFTAFGVVFGISAAVWQLVRFVKAQESQESQESQQDTKRDE